MMRWIALLRGINVGGAKKVPMAQLRELLTELAYADVQTYVQSGNVVFEGPDDPADALAARISAALRDTFGFDVAVILRTRDELAAVVAAEPFGDQVDNPARLHVVFLDRAVDAAGLSAIDQAAYAPDAFVVSGRELYLWTPNGIGRSRLAQALTDKRLGGAATARNWRTVERLLAMADELG